MPPSVTSSIKVTPRPLRSINDSTSFSFLNRPANGRDIARIFIDNRFTAAPGVDSNLVWDFDDYDDGAATTSTRTTIALEDGRWVFGSFPEGTCGNLSFSTSTAANFDTSVDQGIDKVQQEDRNCQQIRIQDGRADNHWRII